MPIEKQPNPIPIQTGIAGVEVTIHRRPYNPTPVQNEMLPNPGTARANIAATLDAPDGTLTDNWAAMHSHRTVLQQHVDFFDQDGDGVIWPSDTYRGMRALGFGIFLSLLAAIGINAGLSYPTLKSWIPDPFLRIYTENIYKGKHGSDTGNYDNEGRFIPQKFEDFFEKYSSAPGKDSLSKSDIRNGLRGQRLFADVAGRIAASAEWYFFYLLISPEDGLIKKEDVRRLYDGSLFASISERNHMQRVNRNQDQAD